MEKLLFLGYLRTNKRNTDERGILYLKEEGDHKGWEVNVIKACFTHVGNTIVKHIIYNY